MRSLAALAAVLVLVGCTDRLATSGDIPKTRTYSQNVQTVTSDQRCQDCHKKQKGQEFAIGTYEKDIKKKGNIKIMVTTNANPAYDHVNGFLTPQQIQDVVDWVDAGAPNDGTPY